MPSVSASLLSLRATLLLLALLLPCLASAEEFRTKADKAYMIDAETGTVLFAKDEDSPVPPASLAKIMTMETVFNEIKSGRLSLEDEFEVSENAWRTGGAVSRTSTMFAEIHSSIRVEDLIKGAIIQSGNDSCIVLAEGIAGTEQSFARKMTERARELGMETSVFANSTGLPHPDSRVTMRELVNLAQYTQETYPELYKWYSEPQFEWNGINQRNRNPLLRYDMGADGLKTGYTEESGYGIVASVKRDDRRLFVAMSGMASEKERAEETRKILEWGLRSFEKRKLFDAGQVIGTVGVFDGDGSGVDLAPKEPVYVYIPIANADRLKARILYDWPLKAPVRQGDQVGRVRVWIGDTMSQETPLYAANDVPVGPLHWRAVGAVQELLFFWL